MSGMGIWENITKSCNFGYIPGSFGLVYKNEKLRIVYFWIVADNVNNQSTILNVGTLPGGVLPIVIGIGVHETSGVSVCLQNDGALVKSSHSKDVAISKARYLGILLF